MNIWYVWTNISIFTMFKLKLCFTKSTRDAAPSPKIPAPAPEPISDFVPSPTATAKFNSAPEPIELDPLSNPTSTSLEEEEMEFVSTETENGWCHNNRQCPRSNERCISNRCVKPVTCRRGRDCLSNERCNISGYCVRNDRKARNSGDTCKRNGECGAHQICNNIGHCERRQAAMETSRGLRGRN